MYEKKILKRSLESYTCVSTKQQVMAYDNAVVMPLQ